MSLKSSEQSMSNYGDKEIQSIESRPLERWVNEHGSFHIHLEHPEFSALCPRSGYPDSGSIIVDYIPSGWLVELKDFKLYINSFRDQRISHENATNQIADRLFSEIAPASLRVIGDFMRRGGIKTVITVSKGEDYSFPVYHRGDL